MATRINYPTEYAKQLWHLNCGHALFTPALTDEIQIGQCGWFDERGDWNSIVTLSDPDEVRSEGFTPMKDPPRPVGGKIDDTIELRDCKSSSVMAKEAVADAGVA